MTGHPPLVALVHATLASIAPAIAAFEDVYPTARRRNLLDDTLISDAEEADGVTPPLWQRMRGVIGYAVDSGADAVLLSCSMYGPVADEVGREQRIPVLASDRALFDETARLAPSRVAVLGPVDAGTHDTVERLSARLGPATGVRGATVDGVRSALAAGAVERAGELVAAASRTAVEEGAEVVVLGQFSLAPTLEHARAAVDVPVLCPPHLAARAIRAALAPAVPA